MFIDNPLYEFMASVLPSNLVIYAQLILAVFVMIFLGLITYAMVKQ
jgi:hypothetical protein